MVAVDVGRGQLEDRLRRDPRVRRSIGRTSAWRRSPTSAGTVSGGRRRPVVHLPAPGGRQLAGWTAPGGHLIVLVEPQFEAGGPEVCGGRGVVRDPPVWEPPSGTSFRPGHGRRDHGGSWSHRSGGPTATSSSWFIRGLGRSQADLPMSAGTSRRRWRPPRFCPGCERGCHRFRHAHPASGRHQGWPRRPRPGCGGRATWPPFSIRTGPDPATANGRAHLDLAVSLGGTAPCCAPWTW